MPPIIAATSARLHPARRPRGRERARAASARAALAGTLLASCLGSLAGCARPPARPNVLLVVVDTLRADRLSAAGYPRETTPELDAFAAGAVRFTHAQSPRAKTTPAVASLLTGLYPHDHGVRDLTRPLPPSVPVLPEVLRDAGYSTFAVVGNYVLSRDLSGLDRGFDDWDEEFDDTVGVPPHDVPQRRADSVTDAAIEALEGRVLAEEPWFGWVHYMDPHGLYDPPPAYRVFASEEPDPLTDPALLPPHPILRGKIATYNIPPSTRLPDGTPDANRVRDLYDGEVRFVDEQIGRLLDWLEASGELEETIVVVTADHGESLGEHRYWFEHGLYAYEVTCRVPLVVRVPAILEARAEPGVRDGDISLVDLGPTIVELAGLPRSFRRLGAAEGPHGVSRVALLERDDLAPHPVFSEKVERTEVSRTIQTKAVRIGDWKLIRRTTYLSAQDGRTPRELVVLSEELYDLVGDPGEEDDLVAEPPEGAPLARLRHELDRFYTADGEFAGLAQRLQEDRNRLEREDPETLRILEALGY